MIATIFAAMLAVQASPPATPTLPHDSRPEPREDSIEDRLERTDVRAPVSGYINELFIQSTCTPLSILTNLRDPDQNVQFFPNFDGF